MQHNKQTLSLNQTEKEILTLKSVFDLINDLVNYNMMRLSHQNPNSEICFKSDVHQKFFYIKLLDFLSDGHKIWGVEKTFTDALQDICSQPQLKSYIEQLKQETDNFGAWLNDFVQFEHDGEIRKLWFPSIEKEVSLKITRLQAIKICGNKAKHNTYILSRQAKAIRKIFKDNGYEIELPDAFLIFEEFFEQFHEDILTYHGSTVAEFLNNIRWAIYEYLQPIHSEVTEYYWNEKLHLKMYRYHYPENVTNNFVRKVFWDLMNDVRSKPYMPRFQTTRFLKMRY